MTILPTLRNWLAWLLLTFIIAGGFALRVWNVNFDAGTGSHPDERSTACFYAPSLRMPASWEQALNPKQSPLNPLWDVASQSRRAFTYGHLPLYLGTAAGEALHLLAPAAARVGLPDETVSIMARAHEACDAIAVAGRLTIAIFDTLTILFIFLLATALYSNVAGLLAAGFYAFTAQAVQLSHFFAMDPVSTTFTVWAVLGGVIMLQRRGTRRFRRGVWAAGLGSGLAIASKFSALPILAVPIVAAFLAIYAESRAARAAGRGPDGRVQGQALFGALLALLIAAISFILTSPYAILDWRNFIYNTLVEQGAMVRGVADFPFTRQYRNTVPYIYFIQQQVVWGMGVALGLVALAGAGWALWRLLRTLWEMIRGRALDERRQSEVVLWAWVVPYFGITGLFLAKFNRYMSPVLPFVLIFAAGMIAHLLRRPGPREVDGAGLRRGLGGLLATLGMVGGLLWSLAYVNGVYGREHTWVTASRWIYENVPAGSNILWELWDDPLPKVLLTEPGLDVYSAGLRNIDWGPYEEDTAEKYEILKRVLREADYVAYSSKRIYDSVDELPRRYPMTNLYYEAMWDGRLGFELAAEFTAPPRLFGLTFDDRSADESWSLYDHPQVTLFRKVRNLSDAEFDALLANSWENAIPWDRGETHWWMRPLNAIGMGSDQAAADRGLLNRAVAGLLGGSRPAPAAQHDLNALLLDRPLRELPEVDNFRWNTPASLSPWVAAGSWWAVLALLGLAAWPLTFWLLRPLRDRGYLLSRMAGWLLAGWLLWIAASLRLVTFTVANAWYTVALLAAAGTVAAWRQRRAMGTFLRARWPLLLLGEVVLGFAFAGFVGIRLLNPDLWQPWYGGEKFMEMAFLTGILRSPWFPPVDPHFAGGIINYYYFGLYLVAYLIKLTGIWAEVAFNLAIPTLFALTVAGAFSVAHSAITSRAGRPTSSASDAVTPGAWRSSLRGAGGALLAPLFVAVIGNLDAFAQIVRSLGALSASSFQSALPLLQPLVRAAGGLRQVAIGAARLPDYDFWGPSRVIPATINEFPWWSFLFADLHPHIIGMPIAMLFLGFVLALVQQGGIDWARQKRYIAALLAAFGLLLGALASVNLWELPTYFVLGLLALLVSQFLGAGRIRWGVSFGLAILYAAVAGLTFAPFLLRYTNTGASGVGLVRMGDAPGTWLLIWGFFTFVLGSWLLWQATRPSRPILDETGAAPRPLPGPERLTSLALRGFDRLPRLLHLLPTLNWRPTLGTLLLSALLPLALPLALLALWFDRAVLALCLPLLALAFVLLWRRGRAATPGTQFALILTVAGFAILAGTQVVYLKDFLSGGDWYRMNTIFKFFSQVWLLYGVAGAVAVAQLWRGWVRAGTMRRAWRNLWAAAFLTLLVLSLSYTFIGTPARLKQRMVGWRPPIGTLDGLAFMEQGSYSWPDGSNVIELAYDWAAIRRLLEATPSTNKGGPTLPMNATIMESSEADYYRAGSSRVASLTGLSGLRGMHEGEQRWPEQVGAREALHREFWNTPEPARMEEILAGLQVDLIYVGQLERYLHPEAVIRLERLAAAGALTPFFENERTTIYLVN